MRISPKGFTLVEVLIVVVIIAILAALILPRLVHQTANAHIAGMERTLGILKRAQQRMEETSGSFLSLTVDDTQLDMPRLGLKAINDFAAQYRCDDQGTCYAIYKAYPDRVIALDQNGTFNCTGWATIEGNRGCRA